MGILWLLIVAGPLLAEPTDWPEFLGPRGAAHAGPDSDIPLRWNDRLNILWRTPLPGRGWSSPVVPGDAIWLLHLRQLREALGEQGALVVLGRSLGAAVAPREDAGVQAR